jgi:hypothetical protein
MEIWNLSSPEKKDREEMVAFSLLLKDIGSAAASQGMEEACLTQLHVLEKSEKRRHQKALKSKLSIPLYCLKK